MRLWDDAGDGGKGVAHGQLLAVLGVSEIWPLAFELHRPFCNHGQREGWVSWAIWITGLPGSGKSTLARAVAETLKSRGIAVKLLELDEVRRVVTPEPTYTEAEREIVYRALAFMARLVTEAGVPVIIDATAHRRAWRDLARRLIPAFAEVQLLCALEVCREREQSRRWGHAPRAVYSRAGKPGATVPGVDVPYEAALRPEVTLRTDELDLWTQVQQVLHLARRLDRTATVFELRVERRPLCE